MSWFISCRMYLQDIEWDSAMLAFSSIVRSFISSVRFCLQAAEFSRLSGPRKTHRRSLAHVTHSLQVEKYMEYSRPLQFTCWQWNTQVCATCLWRRYEVLFSCSMQCLPCSLCYPLLNNTNSVGKNWHPASCTLISYCSLLWSSCGNKEKCALCVLRQCCLYRLRASLLFSGQM